MSNHILFNNIFIYINLVDMQHVTRIRRGQHTDRFHKKGRNIHIEHEDKSFSLVFGDSGLTLDLIALTATDFELWYYGLTKVAQDFASERAKLSLDVLYLKSRWELADKDGNGTLDQDEIICMLSEINANFSKEKILPLFYQCDADRSGVLDFKEFTVFFQILRKRFRVSLFYWAHITKCIDIFAFMRYYLQ